MNYDLIADRWAVDYCGVVLDAVVVVVAVAVAVVVEQANLHYWCFL